MSKGLISVIRGLLSVIGIILIIDCAALMVVGKVNFGSVVPFLVGMVFVIHGMFWHAIRRFCSQHYGFNCLWYGLWAVFILWLLSFALFIWSLRQQITLSQQPAPTVAAIIILGSGTVQVSRHRRSPSAWTPLCPLSRRNQMLW